MWGGPGTFLPLLPSSPTATSFPNAGHRIPMLSDDSPIDYLRPPLPSIPPTPAKPLPQTGGIDWSLIASCSPESIAESNDIATINAVIETFVRAEFTQTEAQLLPNPLTAKLFRLLQIGVHHLLDCQEELRDEIAESERSRATLSSKVKHLSSSLEHLRDAQSRKSTALEQTEKCIICGKKFKNVTYLDRHVERRHSALVPAWRSLRTGELQGYGDMMDQIAELRQAVAATNFQLVKRQDVAKPSAPAAAKRDPQIQIIEEFGRKQDELMEQARLQEEKQLNFRREIRNQLDDAVLALRESHRDFLAEAKRITQLPAMPIAPPPPDEPLAASLTGQLMKPVLTPEVAQGAPVSRRRVSLAIDKLLEEGKPEPPQPAIAVSEAMQRQMKQDQIMAAIAVEEEEEEASEQQQAPTVVPFLTRGQANEQLILRAQQLIARAPDLGESPRKEQAVRAITAEVLARVDRRLNDLKKKRSYAPLSVPFVQKQLTPSGREYKAAYERMKLFVASEIPAAADVRRHLFKERKTRFPALPTIPTIPEEGGHEAAAEEAGGAVGAKALERAGKRLPFRQRQHRKRPLGMPADQVVEEVSEFSSEMDSSESTVPYMEDRNYYQSKRQRSSSSPVIEPLKEQPDIVEMGGFAELSSSASFEEIKTEEMQARSERELTMKAGADTLQLNARDLVKGKKEMGKVSDDLVDDISSDSQPAKAKKSVTGKLDSDFDESF